MRILSPVTPLPRSAFRIDHDPPDRRYDRHRSCLRRQFGFRCAFCLLHETDFANYGIARTGLFWIEHFLPRETHPALTHSFANLRYACRFCNRAKGRTPVRDPDTGVQVLDPTGVAWGKHFTLHGDEMRPNPGNDDAAHTWETVQLDDPLKVRMRRDRREVITHALQTIEALLERIRQLDACLLDEELAPASEAAIIGAIRELEGLVTDAIATLGRFVAVPADAPARCGCDPDRPYRTPRSLYRSTQEIPLDPT